MKKILLFLVLLLCVLVGCDQQERIIIGTYENTYPPFKHGTLTSYESPIIYEYLKNFDGSKYKAHEHNPVGDGVALIVQTNKKGYTLYYLGNKYVFIFDKYYEIPDFPEDIIRIIDKYK